MTLKKYPVEKATKEKINELFTYRKLTDLLKITGLDKNQEFVSHLYDVQYQIYMLDAYLENQWELKKEELEVYWDAINLSLQNLGYKKKQIKPLTEEIKEYQKIEKNCRKEKWPTRETFSNFYTSKSCDVRLIRHLIYKANPGLKKLWKEDSWIYYDLITELHDDIADVGEDIHTYNGNRFLISLLRNGVDKTHDAYEHYLMNITEKAQIYFSKKLETGKNKQLAGWTSAQSKATLKLLNARISSTLLSKLSQALLLEHMN